MIKRYSSKGFNCFCFGYKKLNKEEIDADNQQLKKGVIFLGLFMIRNQLNEEGVELIKNLKNKNLNCRLISSKKLYETLSLSSRLKIYNENDYIITGFTKNINGVKHLQWEKIE